MRASRFGRLPVVDHLLSLGCDVNLQTNTGKTALMMACQEGRVEIVKILLAHGADTLIKNRKGKKAIDLTESDEIKILLQGDSPFLSPFLSLALSAIHSLSLSHTNTHYLSLPSSSP